MCEDHHTPFRVAFLSGAFAGVIVDVVLFPLETIKTRLQCASGFVATGGFRNIYSGLSAGALGAGPNAGVFFLVYETVKAWNPADGLYTINGNVGKSPHCGNSFLVDTDLLNCAIAAVCGETAGCLVSVPTEVIKQRMQVAKGLSTYQINGTAGVPTARSNNVTFRSMVAQTYRYSGGIGGLYTGFYAQLAREIPCSLLQLPLYEGLNKSWLKYRIEKGQITMLNGEQPALDPLRAACCGSIAGGVAAAITMPMDVIKTRQMTADIGNANMDAVSNFPNTIPNAVRDNTIRNIVRDIVTTNGMKGFFRGILPRVSWISLEGFIVFGIYEAGKLILNSGRSK